MLVDEVVAGQILKEEFENDSCPYDCGSNVQLIVMVDEVFDGQMLVEEFDLAFHPDHRHREERLSSSHCFNLLVDFANHFAAC